MQNRFDPQFPAGSTEASVIPSALDQVLRAAVPAAFCGAGVPGRDRAHSCRGEGDARLFQTLIAGALF